MDGWKTVPSSRLLETLTLCLVPGLIPGDQNLLSVDLLVCSGSAGSSGQQMCGFAFLLP